MSDKPIEGKEAAIQQFNENVDRALMVIYDTNKKLMDDGIPPVCIALANAMSAADLTAAMVVSMSPGGTPETVDQMLERLLEDMKARGHTAFANYTAKHAGAA